MFPMHQADGNEWYITDENDNQVISGSPEECKHWLDLKESIERKSLAWRIVDKFARCFRFLFRSAIDPKEDAGPKLKV